jgi:hypothetical protein
VADNVTKKQMDAMAKLHVFQLQQNIFDNAVALVHPTRYLIRKGRMGVPSTGKV